MSMQSFFPRRQVIAIAAAAIGAGALALAGPARAADPYPSKLVKVVVGYAPGSSTDIVGRLVATKLGELWKQTVIVENRGGAAGNLAADLVAKSPPDGYTLLIAQNGLAISVGGNPSLPFNGEKDLIPVALVAATPHILIVGADSPIKSVKELIAAVKARPGQMSFASSGVGNSDHMAGELFNGMAGLQATHIPYRGGSLAATDVLSGQVDYYFAGMPVGLPQAKGGRARALAVTSKQRFPGAPDVPTVAEAGLPGYEAVLWQGVFAPAGTPKEIVAKIAADVNALLDSADMKEKMSTAGVQILRSTPEQFDAYYRADIARWRRVIKASNIKLGSGS
jgi:tripartite-type tricarboxylate transporter receptor subunit TctC